MAGSSGMHFARVAARTGLISRRQMARWGVDHLRYRVRGATDDETDALLAQIKELLSGVPERNIAWMAPEVLAGILPRIYPQMLDEVRSHQEAGRPVFIVSAAGNELVSLLARVLVMDAGIGTAYAADADGILTGELDGPFMYGEGKVEALRNYAAEHDIDLADLLRLFGLGLRPADAPRGRQRRRRQSGRTRSPGTAKAEGWRVMRFEKLGRRMAIAAATVVAATVGWGGSVLASRRRPPARRLPGRRPTAARRRR